MLIRYLFSFFCYSQEEIVNVKGEAGDWLLLMPKLAKYCAAGEICTWLATTQRAYTLYRW
jgi:hypothetical protein